MGIRYCLNCSAKKPISATLVLSLNNIDGADALRRAIGAADYHPLSVRRFAPAIKRLQRTVVHASKLAR
ncbi:MAG: hypothetical protein ABIL06_14490, partial [Pseudomonadota bacterium]